MKCEIIKLTLWDQLQGRGGVGDHGLQHNSGGIDLY